MRGFTRKRGKLTIKRTYTKLILINANIITLDPLFNKAEWVVIDNDIFGAIGHGNDWRDHRKKNAEIIDCRGKTVLPGFIDAHLHLVAYAKSLVTLDLSPRAGISSIVDIQSRLRHQARRAPAGKWILGRGYNEFYLAEKRHPNRWDLDQATSRHPIRLGHRSGHAHVLNSLALKLIGIGKETGDPDGGMIERDLKTGSPTGLLYEMGGFLSERVPPLDPQALERGLQMANQKLISLGVTSIQDASSGNDEARWQRFNSWKTSGILQPGVYMMIGFEAFKKARRQHSLPALNPTSLRLGAVKIILDDTTGRLIPPQPELNEMALAVHRSGMQIAIHAIEEKTIQAAGTAIRYALDKAPRKEHRHRIEHCSVCPPYLTAQIASSGIMVVTQPPFIYYNGDRYLETVSNHQMQHLYPIATLLKNGVTVAASSDSPIVAPDPLIGIYAAVSRRSKAGQRVLPKEQINALDALQMYTTNAAKATYDESKKGSITPGKLADLVVLNGDPTKLPAEEIKDLEVEMTILDGEIVWDKNA